MKGINELSDRFERRPGHYQDIATEWSSPGKNLEAVLKFSVGLRHRIEDYHENSDIIAEDGNFITVKMAVPHGEWLLSTLLAYGPDVEVLSPKFLRNKVKDRIDQMVSLYKEKQAIKKNRD
jgi:predicted DNA-binding transcriptional regulator YafY